MKINKYKKIVFSFLILSSLIYVGNIGYAAERSFITTEDFNDFAVEPGKTEVLLNPGQHIIKQVTITNRKNKTVNFVLSAEDFIGTNDPKQAVQLLGNEKGPYSIKDFIKPEFTTFSLKFGERITIPVDISVPEKVEPRGYYGALIVSNNPDSISGSQNIDSAEGKTRLVSRIGSLFLVRVNGEGKEEGSINDFKVIGPKKSFYESRPKGFEISFKNTGNVHLVPYGTITIKNLLGKTIDSIPVNAYFSLPDSIRYREVEWKSGFGLGRYTAELSLFKGYNSEFDNAKVSFWILPWKVLLLAFGIIAIFAWFIYYFKTRFELKKK